MVGHTIPHMVTGRFGACVVRLLPASPGTGVIAGAAVRAPLEMMGVQDCLTKSFGSNNSKNLVKAVMNGLSQLRTKEQVQQLRNVELGQTEVEEAIERGQQFMPTSSDGEKAAAPVNVVGEKSGRGGGRRGGGGGRGGRGGGGGRRGAEQTSTSGSDSSSGGSGENASTSSS